MNDDRNRMQIGLQDAASSLHTALEAAEDLQRAGAPADVVAGIEAAMGAVEAAQRTAAAPARVVEQPRAAHHDFEQRPYSLGHDGHPMAAATSLG